MPEYEWSDALARAARHIINEEGSCGTMGDSNSHFVPDVLGRYYAYEYDGLTYTKVTGPELVNTDNF